ncbi:MAG: sulfurtransferase [Actinomycetota bacterium]|nr:sulfurtransferase [Actinomycetota bacterium]
MSTRPLISTDWLRANLGMPSLIVADVRWVPGGSATEAFERGHIPSAILLDADTDLAGKPFTQGPGRHPLPSPEAFASTMSRAGIGDDTTVIAYDDNSGSYAARLWWTLDALGQPAVGVLDGALAAWGGPVETGPAKQREPVTFTAKPWPRELIADAGDVADAIRDANAVVLDARAPERYRGDVEPIDPVAGHIPGARSAPWAGNLDPTTGRFLDPDALRKRYEALGADDTHHAIAQCGSGLTACHDVLALRLAGLGHARLYEGSWSDWVNDPSRPVATGDDAGR